MSPAITTNEDAVRVEPGAGRRAEVVPPRASPRAGRFTFALSATVFSFALMQTLVVPALPTLGHDLGATSQGTGWILTAFLLAGAILAPVVGNLGDRFGHRRVLLAALIGFAAATLVAAVAPNLAVLLAARVVQGVGTATFPLALALARGMLDGPRRAAAFGWIAGMIGLGAGVALVVGGVVVDALSWRWLFVLGAALIVASGAMVAAWVPRTAAPAVARRTDWAGIALLSSGLVGVLLAVSQGSDWGWGSSRTIATGTAGLLLLAILVAVELRVANPVVDVRTFRHGPLVLISLVTIAVGFVPYVCYIALPVLLQAPTSTGYGHGMSVTASALAMLPSAILVFLGGRLTPVLVARIGAGGAATAAGATMALGAAGLALWPTSTVAVVVAFSILGIGNGIGYAICAQLVMAWSPAAEAGAAVGLNSVVRTVGSAAAAPVVVALLSAQGVATHGAAYPFSAAFWVAAGASLLGVAAALTLVARSRRAA
ncbi:MFS transporter [Cellulomonas sp. PhB150]|uniref:MFS transporter n=1 Tax=Cellulomonas sp. PhB150 TaxID=2485188 RepID=UPI000F490FEE|nr:MFS transporter [Cellulomonas sp. PhB150]ROS31168.1 MFS transporter [Cellulomonas sp. PhB150]